MPGRIRKIDAESELAAIEDEVDAIIRNELAKSSHRDDDDSDIQSLMLVAQRIDNLVHYRRAMLTAGAPPGSHAV